MAIEFVGQSKEARNHARRVAIRYLIEHPNVGLVDVYRKQFNYRKEVDEVVLAGHVIRKNGGFYWMSWGNDRSSGTYINREGESTDPVWWYQVRKSLGGKDVAVVKTLTEARRDAIDILNKEGGNNLYIVKNGCYYPGFVSKAKDRAGYVWIAYKNIAKPTGIAGQYVLNKDGSLGRKL